MTDALQLRDNAKGQLLKIKNIETGIDYLKKLKTFEFWAKAEKKDAELQNIIAAQKIRTQRILGGLIKEGQDRNEIAKKGKFSNLTDDEIITGGKKKKLIDIGITHNQSATFQKIHSIPVETFEQAIVAHEKDVENESFELTTSSFLKLANKLNGKSPYRDEPIDSFNNAKLIELIEREGLSFYQLAMSTGTEVSTISRLCSGEMKAPTFDTVARIAEYFNEPMESFKKGNLL